MAESFYRCTACRRCSLECPLGVDHGLVTHLGRYILSEIGIVPKALQVSVRAQLHGNSHNTSAIPVKGLLDNLEFLEEELEEMKGVEYQVPGGPDGCQVRLLPGRQRLSDGGGHADGQRRRAPCGR